MTESPPTRYSFRAAVELDPLVADGYMKHYLALPIRVARGLKKASVSRVVGQIGEVPFRRALQKRDDGSLCLKFGAGWLRDAKITIGAVLPVTLSADPDPDHVDIPDELAILFEQDPEIALAWEALTAGKRRTLVYPITRAKRPATRQHRAAEVARQIRELMEDMQW